MTARAVRLAAHLAALCVSAAVAHASPTLVFAPEFQLRTTGWRCATGDITGDGRPDFVFVQPFDSTHADRVDVFAGGEGFGPDASYSLAGPGAGFHFRGPGAGGDVTGDGIADLVLSGTNGAVFVYIGPVRADATPSMSLRPEPFAARDTAGDFGCAVSIAPDIDGDGFNDIVVAAYQGDPGAYVFRGGAHPDSVPDIACRTPHSSRFFTFGSEACGIGDVDGDGRGEIAVVEPHGLWYVWIYRGGVGPDLYTSQVLLSYKDYYDAFAPAGDYDGDGVPDVLLAGVFVGPGVVSSDVSVYSGSQATLSPWPGQHVTGGNFLAFGGGDVTGDGLSDILVCGQGYYWGYGPPYLQIFRGPGGHGTTPDDTMTVGAFGTPLVVGDITGDGYGDFILGRTFFNSHEPRVASWTVASPPQGALWPIGADRAVQWSGATRANLAWIAADSTRTAIVRNAGGAASNAYTLRVPRLTTPQAQIEITAGDSTGATGRTLSSSITLTDSTWTTYFHTTARNGAHGRVLHWDTWPPLADLKQYAIDRRTLVGTWWRMVDSLRDTVFVDVGGEQPAIYRLVTVNRLGDARIAGTSVPLDTLPAVDTTSGEVPGDTLSPPGIARAFPQPCGAGGCSIVLGITNAVPQQARMRLYDVHGAQVRTLTGTVGRAPTTLHWDGRDDAGRRVPSGVYDARIESGATRHRLRVLVVR